MAQLLSDAVTLTESQQLVQTSVRDVCSNFDHQYWRDQVEAGEYPREFVDTLIDHGWMGFSFEAYGGAGMGTRETVVMMEEIAANGGGFSAAQAVHGGVYNSVPIVEYASEELKRELLPRVADGEASIQAFGLTEPNAGSNSTAIETSAETDGNEYVINGQKIWTSRVDVSGLHRPRRADDAARGRRQADARDLDVPRRYRGRHRTGGTRDGSDPQVRQRLCSLVRTLVR